MAVDRERERALAFHRFGFGPRPASLRPAAGDVRELLRSELDQPQAGQILDKTLLSAAQSGIAAFNFRQRRQARQIVQRMEADARTAGGGGMSNPMEQAPPTAATAEPNVEQENYFKEVKARLDAALGAEVGFVERLVWFWSNHFCVSADVVPNLAGGYEREAIRPHVLGRFADMLLAVASHPAMLFYLDNSRSVGPRSPAGLVGSRGLNENLARETLELHTLGVRSVYSQDDVTSFAKVLTGWTITPVANNPLHGNEFAFNPNTHEPGPQTVLGKRYEDTGATQAQAVLADLARHPATAAFIAFKLARHFVSDTPPPALVERLKQRFLDTDGDLKQVALVLIEAPEAWTPERLKLKRPSEWLISIGRGLGTTAPPQQALQAQAYLGERLWRPPAPKGFADEAGAWMDGISLRLDIANRIAERVPAARDPMEFVKATLGSLASRETREAVERAESRQQAFTLALMAPEFQRR